MGLDTITLVTVAVTDQDAAKDFYVRRLGFTEKFDYRMDAAEAGSAGAGARWLMLTPPGGGPDITLSTWSSPPGTATLAIGCADADETHRHLTATGAAPAAPPQDAAWGRWFPVADPDGNTWLVVAPLRIGSTGTG